MFLEKYEEDLYLPIIKEFGKENIDYALIGKVIVDVCHELGDLNENTDPKIIVKNALLLVLGLLHRNKPVEDYGKDLWSLDEDNIETVKERLKNIFNGE